MTPRRPRPGDENRDRPLRLLPPRLVPLSADQERQAVDALAGLLAGLLARQNGTEDQRGNVRPLHPLDVPGDDEAA